MKYSHFSFSMKIYKINNFVVEDDQAYSNPEPSADENDCPRSSGSCDQNANQLLHSSDRIGDTLISKVFVTKVIKDACQFAQMNESSEKWMQNNIDKVFFDNLNILRQLLRDYPAVLEYMSNEFAHVFLAIAQTLQSLDLKDADFKNFAEQIFGILEPMVKRAAGGLFSIIEENTIAEICVSMLYSLQPDIMLLCSSILGIPFILNVMVKYLKKKKECKNYRPHYQEWQN